MRLDNFIVKQCGGGGGGRTREKGTVLVDLIQNIESNLHIAMKDAEIARSANVIRHCQVTL